MERIRRNIVAGPRPDFLKAPTRKLARANRLRNNLRLKSLHTVCEEARCPNLGECFSRKTSTFMILGKTCTRSCRFCAVDKGIPEAVDPCEASRLAQMALELELKHVVITSVTRDDLEDGGAEQFRQSVLAVEKVLPDSSVEVLTPDFGGRKESLSRVLSAAPDVFNHNLETVPRLYPVVRPEADYRRSLSLLRFAAENAPGVVVKSGIMAGMGETRDEIISLMQELADAGCSIITIGQYLAPSRRHWPVERYYELSEYEELKAIGTEIGFDYVFAGPLVRSSFHAGEIYRALGSPTGPADAIAHSGGGNDL
jgi:lipoic acid synthetase